MIVIKIPCDECELTAAEIEDGDLVIKSKHHGGKHTTRKKLVDLLLENEAALYTLMRGG